MIELRPYQSEFVSDLAQAFRGHQCVVGVLPCGGGKTPTMAEMARRSAAKGNTVIATMPRIELLRQTAMTFDSFNLEYGRIAAGSSANPFARIQLASMPTLQRRYQRWRPTFLIVDEAHFSLAKGQREVIEFYMSYGCKVLMLTASPERLDGRGLGEIAGAMIEGPDVSWLIDAGFLSSYRAYAPAKPNLDGVHFRMGDYVNGELQQAMDKPSVTGQAAQAWGQYARGKRTICYCVSREHSRNTVDRFNALGISAEHMDGETPDDQRKAIIRRFASGKTMVLSNCEIATVGFDLSAQIGQDVPIEAVALLRPTQSRALHIQMVGRALRRKPYPAIILDHADNLARHGLPDSPIEWSLEGRIGSGRGASQRTISTMTCEQCYACQTPTLRCRYCGHMREVDGRTVTEEEGELAEIDVRAMRELAEARDREFEKRELRKEEGMARTLQDWQRIAVQRGYKPAWAHFRYNARRQRA